MAYIRCAHAHTYPYYPLENCKPSICINGFYHQYFIDTNTPAWLDAQENWVIDGVFSMISNFKEYCYYHSVMQFYGFGGGNDAEVYRRLTGGHDSYTQWAFAHIMNQTSITQPFQKPEALAPIISFMVTDPISIHNKICDTFRVYRSLVKIFRHTPLLNNQFSINCLKLGPICISKFLIICISNLTFCLNPAVIGTPNKIWKCTSGGRA